MRGSLDPNPSCKEGDCFLPHPTATHRLKRISTTRHSMPSLAITGTIGSGKTTALNILCSVIRESGYPCQRFSADEMNRSLLEHDADVKRLIAQHLGEACLNRSGAIDREVLFRKISTDSRNRTLLESILHPRIRSRWKPLAEGHRGRPGAFFVAEIPLLFEKNLETFFDRTLLLGCTGAVREERLRINRDTPPGKAAAWLSIQQSQEAKITRSDHLLWNDGTLISLTSQIRRFLHTLTAR